MITIPRYDTVEIAHSEENDIICCDLTSLGASHAGYTQGIAGFYLNINKFVKDII